MVSRAHREHTAHSKHGHSNYSRAGACVWAATVDGEGALHHARQRGEGDMRHVVRDLRVDLVREHQHMRVFRSAEHGGERLELRRADDRARGVAGVAQDEHARARREDGLEARHGGHVVVRGQRGQYHGRRAREQHDVGVRRVVGRRDDHLVALPAGGEHHLVDGLLAAAGDHHLIHTVRGPLELLEVLADRRPQLEGA